MTPILRTCALLALLAAVLPAQAQSISVDQFPAIAVGQTINGSLSHSNPSTTWRGPFTVYRFEASPDVRYVVDMRSSDFDAFVSVLRPVGGITELIADDDDGGVGTDARLRLRVDHPGTYLIMAQSLGDATGRFSLSLSEFEPPPPPVARAAAVGDVINGLLSEESSVFVTDWDSEVPHDLYRLELTAGQRLLITMDSEELDSYLEFGPLMGDHSIDMTDYDDDSGSGRDARMLVTVPASGTYGVRARAYGEYGYGRYTLGIREYEPVPLTSRPIRIGEELSGELTDSDALIERGSYAHQYSFRGEAGERVYIRMRSDDLDSYLLFGSLTPSGLDVLAENDDAPDDGVNSLIEYVLPATGEYGIHATSLWQGRTGAYTISVLRNP
jgi:hypothetical protein